MADIIPLGMADGGIARRLDPQWNQAMITASLAISLLGAFTSTQLMCQARLSLNFSSVFVWTLLASLTFGFCSIWSLHEVAMLACELDLPIGIDVPLTIVSSLLAVFFTFAALASDLLWNRYTRSRKKRARQARRARREMDTSMMTLTREVSAKSLLRPSEEEEDEVSDDEDGSQEQSRFNALRRDSFEASNEVTPYHDIDDRPQSPKSDGSSMAADPESQINGLLPDNVTTLTRPTISPVQSSQPPVISSLDEYAESMSAVSESLRDSSSNVSGSRRSSSFMSSSGSSYGLGSMINTAYRRGTAGGKNAFLVTAEALYYGFDRKNIIKSFCWSLAITSMHYVGIAGLKIPSGYYTLNPGLFILSALISWVVCFAGCILMAQMETHLSQQFLFSFVATAGVAAMHFTGMEAVTFWSELPPSDARGYPPALPVAIVSIAITTCIAANGLLAHSATVSRNKLAEVVWTRRKLWRTIAQKENAEAAAAARSDFIASASHEIRTPLHHLQGYSDLLSRTELTEEGRMLLYAIQRATKTLSLITNNVLDWSKLERDSEAVCRPVALDMRTVCESIIVLLPNKDDEAEVELMVVVTPEVPESLFLDETYIHRILMNLLSNAIKFTRSGYILLLVEIQNGKLVATVKDTGCGVPPSFLPQLFEPFKQAQTRGSQRGTGLGLSIIKQLLHKMQGTISVESRHPEAEDVEPGQTGSTFTIEIPVQLSAPRRNGSVSAKIPKIAILHGENPRSLEGLCTAWQKFGYDPVVVQSFSDLAGSEWKFIWTDVPFLKNHPQQLRQILDQDKWQVFVPYDSQKMLQEVPGLLSSNNFIPLQKPLIWYSFKQRIAVASQAPTAVATLSRTVRFAPNVDVLDGTDNKQLQDEATSKNLLILLVEDNPINQKLGKKMLTTLGYDVITAEDGCEALEQLRLHDATVDAILMDQSMPRKDGVTATREIRELEAAGTLLRHRPIIAVTAVVSTEAQVLFKDAGADDFLAKPLSLKKLETTLAMHLPERWR